MSIPFGSLAVEMDLFSPQSLVVSPRCVPHRVISEVACNVKGASITHLSASGVWQSTVDSPVPLSISQKSCDLDCEGGSASSPGLSSRLESASDNNSDEESDVVPEPQETRLASFIIFLESNNMLLQRLLKCSRRSSFISRNADIRFVALHIMFSFVEVTCGGAFTGGTRAQGVLVATCLSLAAKYCEQTAYLPTIINETGLDRSATVAIADVVEKEIEVLSAIDYHITVPSYWESIVRVALHLPTTAETTARDRRNQGPKVTKEQQHRVYFAATFTDRILYYIARNPSAVRSIISIRADETALGASIAVAAGLATPEESVSTIFTPFSLGNGDESGMTLPDDIANVYAYCVAILAGLLSESVS